MKTAENLKPVIEAAEIISKMSDAAIGLLGRGVLEGIAAHLKPLAEKKFVWRETLPDADRRSIVTRPHFRATVDDAYLNVYFYHASSDDGEDESPWCWSVFDRRLVNARLFASGFATSLEEGMAKAEASYAEMLAKTDEAA